MCFTAPKIDESEYTRQILKWDWSNFER